MLSQENAYQPSAATIRPCREGDLQLVAHFTAEWEAEDITTGYGAEDAADLRARLGPFFLLALWDEEVVGFVTASLYEAAPGEIAIFAAGGHYLEIDELYVLPAYLEQAIGTTLMQAVMQAARRHGIEHFSVYPSTKQWRSITAFYEQLGFQMGFVRMFH
jgi:GNAT superfamily N-acetyltransferase